MWFKLRWNNNLKHEIEEHKLIIFLSISNEMNHVPLSNMILLALLIMVVFLTRNFLVPLHALLLVFMCGAMEMTLHNMIRQW